MSFENISYLFAGVLTAVFLVFFYIFTIRKKNKLMEKFADKSLLKQINTQAAGSSRKIIKILLNILAVLFLFIALGRPQWGFEWVEIKNKGTDMLFAIDISKSMLSQDITPSRLERTKLEIGNFVKNLHGDRTGIVAFAGNAMLYCPLTSDYSGFQINLKALDTNMASEEGTSIAEAINKCTEVYQRTSSKEKLVILITDGEDHKGNVVEAAHAASDNGIKIFCIGIGTKQGSQIMIQNENKPAQPLRDLSGRVIQTRLNEDILKKIAFITRGSYARATSTNFMLSDIYDNTISKIQKETMQTDIEKRPKERFQIFLIMALLLLVAELLIGQTRGV